MADLPLSVTFVIPCLNEEGTLASVLEKINRLRKNELAVRSTEIVVADNGSTDDSVRIAEEHGARVVHCAERGYGAALRYGIENAKLGAVIFADADDTYDLLEAPGLLRELDKGHDLVIGSRLRGTIHPGAMPALHRWLGTPTLNFFINRLHAKDGVRISDCNSGFRCFTRSAFATWEVEGSGMEFASEMLLKALKSRAKISEVPITLRPDTRDRQPHLKTWRDGMRHLLQVFLQAPQFFHYTGAVISLVSWALLLIGWWAGPTKIGFASVFGLHTMMFALLGSFFGLTLWSIGLLLSVRIPSAVRTYRWLLDLGEGHLFWIAALFLVVSSGFFLAILVRWATNGFEFLALERETMLLTAFGANGILLVFNVITAHMIKQMRR
jgi:glycosyltransferase involved in cell wall biosynthesis